MTKVTWVFYFNTCGLNLFWIKLGGIDSKDQQLEIDGLRSRGMFEDAMNTMTSNMEKASIKFDELGNELR